jgi:hypothetical protein
VKQHGGVFGLFAGVFLICLIRAPWLGRFYAAICFGAGCLVPLLTVVAVMFLVGTLPNFWFWTVEYALQYASQASLSEGAVNLLRWFEGQWFAAGLLCSFTLIGMLALLRQRTATSMEPILLLIASMLATVPGFYFRSHYFILAVPSVCLLGGYGIFVASQWLSARLRGSQNLSAAGLLSLLLLTFLWSSRNLLLLVPLDEVSRLIFGANPFVESREIAQYIRERTSEDERIAIIGSEPQIYFYANRRAATGYIYMYALMEDHPFSQQMQQQVIEEVESVNPNYLVYVNVPNSWLVRPGSDRTIFNWYSQYVQSYDLVGLVALAQDGATYYWDAELPNDINMMTMGVYIYKRANR